MTAIAGGLAIPLLLIPLMGAADSEPDPEDAHGVFTGEMKSVFYVVDVEVAAPFYRDVLGFEFQGFAERDGNPYYAEMVADRVKFALHEPMSQRQEAKVGQQRLYFRVKDLEAHRTGVVARGGEAGDIKVTEWMDMFLVRDPDGNEIIFAFTDLERHSINPWNTDPPKTREAGN